MNITIDWASFTPWLSLLGADRLVSRDVDGFQRSHRWNQWRVGRLIAVLKRVERSDQLALGLCFGVAIVQCHLWCFLADAELSD